MARTITFNELRELKDKLPDGSIHRIAEELDMKPETVRNYFGGYNYKEGRSVGILGRHSHLANRLRGR